MKLVLTILLLSAMTGFGDERDVPYVESPASEQRFDIFWPTGVPKATVLFIHGGSLNEGGERRSSPAYRNVCKPFVAAGIACASMDYRLFPSNKWPAMPEDVAAAVAALRPRIAERGGDPGRLFVFGHSSGCHLASLVAVDGEYLAKHGLKRSDIAGVIAMGCTLDRDDAQVRRLTAGQIRAAFERDAGDVALYGTPEAYLKANPASHIGAGVPPTLIVVAEEERFMPPILEQGARFVRRLLELDVPANLIIVPGKHMSSITNVERPGDATFQAIAAFIDDPRRASAAH
ncbi:MAG TPA: alpha/beta hydrolase [Thermoanaerobaculia bacterium]